MIYPPVGDAFAPRNKYAMKIDFERQPPMFKITDTHYAATWLLHPDAPKVETPKIITDRIARMKIRGRAQDANNQETLLRVEHLCQYFPMEGGELKAVDDVSFEIQKGEYLAWWVSPAAEKTTTGRSIINYTISLLEVCISKGFGLRLEHDPMWMRSIMRKKNISRGLRLQERRRKKEAGKRVGSDHRRK